MAEAVFDEAMKSRLQAFQKAHGLADDGLAATKTWAKLAEAPAEKPAAANDSMPALTAENFPLVFQIAETCPTEQGVKNFLRDEIGVDLDEILADIDAILVADKA
jgi:hypothetical protein